MKLSKLVCSYELANRLNELDVKQVSLFYYDGNKELLYAEYTPTEPMKFPLISAFTVAELGEIISSMYKGNWYSEKYCGLWYCRLHTHNVHQSCTRIIEADTESDSRAKMLIYLIENKLIEYKKE